MANRRREQVGYRRLELPNLLQDGLLDVYRPGGDLDRRVASAFMRLADHYGGVADEEAVLAGTKAGQLAAVNGAPAAQTVAYGESGAPDVDLANPSRYDLRGHLTDPARQPHLDGIEPEFRNRLSTMIEQAPKEIRDQIKLLSGYRSVERQAELWKAALVKYGSPEAARKWVAPPGNSQHNHGRAYDLQYGSDTARQWVHENAGRYGLDFPLGNEPWHIEIAGARGQRPPDARPGVPAESQPPGIVATGGGGTFRPTGGRTLYERAFDAAGTKTYLQMADATMRTDMAAVFREFGDDPAKLRQGLDALLTIHLDGKQGHVFPEIEADYRAAFARQRVGYELESEERARQARLAVDQAQFLERTNELSTQVAQLQTSISADNPLAPAMILEAQAQLDHHYDDAVARKILTPQAAEKGKIEARREAALGFYARQADTLDADGIAQMRKDMASDFSQGKLKHLDGGGWAELETHLRAREQQKRSEDKQANSAYQKRADDMLDRIAAGFDVDEGQLNAFRMDAKTAPDGEAIRDRTSDNIRTARQIRDLPLRDADRLIQEEYRKLTPTSPDEDIERWQLMQSVFDTKQKMLTADPIGYAENNGVIPKTGAITAIEDANDLAGLLTQRAQNAEMIEDHYGVPARYFRPGEAAALQRLVEKQPSAVLGVAEALATAGPQATPRMLAEIAQDAPVLSHVAGLLSLTGDPTVAVEISEGMRLAAVDGFKSRLPSPVQRSQVLAETYGAAFATKPATMVRAQKAADMLFERRIAAQGIDTSDFSSAGNVAREAYAQALNDVLGASEKNGETYGGIAEVNGVETIAPPTMRPADLGYFLSTLSAADMEHQMPLGSANGIAIDPRQLHRGALVYVGPGRYRIALGDPYSNDPRYAPAADGGYFELDMLALERNRAASNDALFSGAMP